MISFYCANCMRFIKNEHNVETEGMSIVNQKTECERCAAPTPIPISKRAQSFADRTHCSKGHPLDGVLNTKRDGLTRYCKTCMKESDKKYKAAHMYPNRRKSRGQEAPVKKWWKRDVT